jgi:hypothetical protein
MFLKNKKKLTNLGVSNTLDKENNVNTNPNDEISKTNFANTLESKLSILKRIFTIFNFRTSILQIT